MTTEGDNTPVTHPTNDTNTIICTAANTAAGRQSLMQLAAKPHNLYLRPTTATHANHAAETGRQTVQRRIDTMQDELDKLRQQFQDYDEAGAAAGGASSKPTQQQLEEHNAQQGTSAAGPPSTAGRAGSTPRAKRLKKMARSAILARNGCVYCKEEGHVVAFCPNAPPKRHAREPDWPPGILTSASGTRRCI